MPSSSLLIQISQSSLAKVPLRYDRAQELHPSFPPDTKAFLYYFTSPEKPRIAGELRLRVASSDDPASFKSGSVPLAEKYDTESVPFDGFLVASLVAVANLKEPHTSSSATVNLKDLIVSAAAAKPEDDTWELEGT
jgi:hypothetical protein